MPLLDDVTDAAERLREKEADASAARQELREKVRAARNEGIAFAVIARAAGLSREWVRRLYAE
jgi:cell division septum initiation protein DivIVA